MFGAPPHPRQTSGWICPANLFNTDAGRQRSAILDAKLTLRNVKIYLYCLDTDSSPIMWGARDHRLSGPVDRA
jgi:hypothetical protein